MRKVMGAPNANALIWHRTLTCSHMNTNIPAFFFFGNDGCRRRLKIEEKENQYAVRVLVHNDRSDNFL